MKKRAISTVILFSLLLSGVSCGSEGTSETTTKSQSDDTTVSDTTAEPTEYDLYPLPEKDMDGFELRFYNYDDTWLTWAINQLDAEEENGDRVNDAIYARNRRVESEYNAVITEITAANTNDNLKNQIMASDDSFDIAMLYDELVSGYFVDGLFDTWDSLPHLDTSRSWWNNDANEVFRINGKQFAAVGDFSLAMLSRGFVMLFNKDMQAKAGLDTNLYDLVRDSKWTFDEFASFSKNFVSDVNGDGVYDENDQYPITGAVKLVFGSMVTGAGVKYITTGDDGNPQFAIPGNTYAFNVFEKLYNIFNGSNLFYNVKKANVHDGSNEALELYGNQKNLFLGTSIMWIEKCRSYNFDMGIIPFPKYDEEQADYHVLVSGAGVATIPVTLPEDRRENVGILLDALCRDSQQNLLPTYKEVVLKTKYARDEDSAEMLDIIFDSLTYDLGLSVWPQDTYYRYMECYLKMNDNFSSVTDKIKNTVEKDISDLVSSLDK